MDEEYVMSISSCFISIEICKVCKEKKDNIGCYIFPDGCAISCCYSEKCLDIAIKSGIVQSIRKGIIPYIKFKNGEYKNGIAIGAKYDNCLNIIVQILIDGEYYNYEVKFLQENPNLELFIDNPMKNFIIECCKKYLNYDKLINLNILN
jgi:hypothetical protein